MSAARNRRKQDYPQQEVEITDEMRELLANFTQEEIDTGVIHTTNPPAPSGSHTIQDLKNAYQIALIENTIGAMLRTVRERHHHSFRDTAEALGVSRARAHQLEQPEANLRIQTLLRYAQVGS